MEELKVAISLLPIMSVLYRQGIIDIAPGTAPYIQLGKEKFVEMFPYAGPVEGRYRIVVDGIEICAVEG